MKKNLLEEALNIFYDLLSLIIIIYSLKFIKTIINKIYF